MGEESDNESEGRGKEKAANEEVDEEDEEQQPGATQTAGGMLGPQAPSVEESLQTPSSEASLPADVPR